MSSAGFHARANAREHFEGAAADLGKLHLAMPGDNDAAAPPLDAGLHDPDRAARRVGEGRGDRLVGTAALNYDMAAGGLDAAFSGIRNIDRGTAHTTVFFSDLEVGPDGTFSRGQSGARIQGGFYGPGHAEAAGIFEQSGIVGACGAKRQ